MLEKKIFVELIAYPDEDKAVIGGMTSSDFDIGMTDGVPMSGNMVNDFLNGLRERNIRFSFKLGKKES